MKGYLFALVLLPLFLAAQTEQEQYIIDGLREESARFDQLTERLFRRDFPRSLKEKENWLTNMGYPIDSMQDAELLPFLFVDSAELRIPLAIMTDADKLAFGLLVTETSGKARIPVNLFQQNNANYQLHDGTNSWRIDAGSSDSFDLRNFLDGTINFVRSEQKDNGVVVYSDRRSAVERGKYAEIWFYPNPQ